MNNVVYRQRDKSIPLNDNKMKTYSHKFIEDKKNSYDKFNLKINKKPKPDPEFKVDNFAISKTRPKTFDTQKRTENQIENKFTINKGRMISYKRPNKSKPFYSDRDKINNFSKENNLMKFKKKTTGFDDLIPFNDIHKLANNENSKRNLNEKNNSKNKINFNNAPILANFIEIEVKKKVNYQLYFNIFYSQ